MICVKEIPATYSATAYPIGRSIRRYDDVDLSFFTKVHVRETEWLPQVIKIPFAKGEYYQIFFDKNDFCLHATSVDHVRALLGRLTSKYTNDAIKEIAQLPNNWNDNGALRFSSEVLREADDLFTLLVSAHITPEVFPTACGTIQFEFENHKGDYLEIEVGRGPSHYYSVEADGKETSGVFVTFKSALNHLREFYKK